MKKILFICGSIEPGHDGVGDYTRMLAGALIERGVECAIIAIMDRHVQAVVNENQNSKGQPINVLRLSKSLPSKIRKAAYQKFIAHLHPDWVSLQYVPYAFSQKGIPLNLPTFLKVKNANFKFHFMIHEAYLGSEGNLKWKLTRNLQISVLKALNSKLKPDVVHTSNKSYQRQLEAIGRTSELLGLFGNIPISDSKRKPNLDSSFRGVYFGAAPKLEDFQCFINAIDQFLDKTDVALEIVFCGQSGEQGENFAKAIRNTSSSNRLSVTEKGRMSEADLAVLFSSVHFGIARVRPRLLGKSGSAIAMLEHGLPLWVPLANSTEEIEEHFDFRVDQCFSDLSELRNSNKEFAPSSRLDEIVNLWMQILIDR